MTDISLAMMTGSAKTVLVLGIFAALRDIAMIVRLTMDLAKEIFVVAITMSVV